LCRGGKSKNCNGKSILQQVKGTFDKRSEERFEGEDGQDIGMPVALYGCEKWRMKKEVVDKLNALELWV